MIDHNSHIDEETRIKNFYGQSKVITLSYDGRDHQRWLWSDANLDRAIKEAREIIKRGETMEVQITHPNVFSPIIKITA